MTESTTCPLCGINERDFDNEPPGPGSYYAHCTRCSMLITSTEHNHTIYPSPVQVKAGTYKAGQSWKTAQTTHPIMESGVHVGYRCVGFDRCGWERRFTPEEMEPCEGHTNHFGYPYKTIKGRCFNSHVHRLERGEIDERGWITEYGREVERLHDEATTWDPGRYIERVHSEGTTWDPRRHF